MSESNVQIYIYITKDNSLPIAIGDCFVHVIQLNDDLLLSRLCPRCKSTCVYLKGKLTIGVARIYSITYA